MAIDKVQEFALAFSHKREDDVLSCLYGAGIVHLTSYIPSTDSDASIATAPPSDSLDVCRFRREQSLSHIADELELAGGVLAFFSEVDPVSKGLVRSFFPDEVYVSSQDLKKTGSIASSGSYSEMMHRTLALKMQLAEHRHQVDELNQKRSAMLPWASLPIDFNEISRWERIGLIVGTIALPELAHVTERLSDRGFVFALDTVSEMSGRRNIVVACLHSQADDVRTELSSMGFVEQDMTRVDGTVASMLERNAQEAGEVQKKIDENQLEVASMLAHRQEIVVYREYLLNERQRLDASQDITRTERCSVVTGYVRAADVKSLEKLCADCGDVVCMTGYAAEADSTPVSITNNKWIKPLEILINMFGFPVYTSFDPTVFLAVPFLLFYGLCLGDVLYGALQIGITIYFMRKYKYSTGVHNFMMVFLYGGVVAMVAGALTGSWGGDLLSTTYLGKGNVISKLVSSLTVIDPLKAAFQFLVFVWMIGAVNQFYGVGLAIYKAARRRDYASIIYDSMGWLLFLPAISALLFIGTKWGMGFRYGYLVALGVGLTLLLLGGARQGKGAGKILTALVNLYGIQSSYGAGSFLGDVLSYSRLLALGLTTSMLASAFNMMGSLVKVPVLGFIVGAIVLLFGHLLNYFMGTMGAFIHSARLTLLEFFGRFYEGGAPRFHRFGCSSEVVKIIDISTVQKN